MADITLPIYWDSGKKTVLLSINWYRNAHWSFQNRFKQDLHSIVGDQLGNLQPVQGPYRLHLDIFYKNPSCDGSNIAALQEKVILDALQDFNILESDTVKYHLGTTWTVAGQDKINPRCEITIHPIEDPNDTTSNQT